MYTWSEPNVNLHVSNYETGRIGTNDNLVLSLSLSFMQVNHLCGKILFTLSRVFHLNKTHLCKNYLFKPSRIFKRIILNYYEHFYR